MKVSLFGPEVQTADSLTQPHRRSTVCRLTRRVAVGRETMAPPHYWSYPMDTTTDFLKLNMGKLSPAT